VVVAAVLVLGGAGAAWAATRSSGTSYRTATAGPATVTATLNLVGTIEPVTEATVKFPVSGQVSAVSVAQGQQVTAGQPLAQLNTTTLAAQVSSDQSQVATEQAKLASDQDSQTSTVSSTSDSSSSSGSSSGGSGSRSSTNLSGLAQSLNGQQTAVRAAQGAVDNDLTLVSGAVKQVNATCPGVIDSLQAAASSAPSSTQSTSSSSTSTDSSTEPTTTSGSGVDTQAADECTTLINQVSGDEAKASADEKSLAGAESALTTALNKAETEVEQAASSSAGSTGSSSRSSTSSSTSSSGSSGSSGSGGSGSSGSGSSSGRSGSSGSSGQPASADQLAADQASVDSANAQLAEAQQSLAAATLVAPISGTVADVTLSTGATVSANSSSADIVIVGPGTSEVTTAVSDSQVGTVKPGQAASVVPDGGSTPINGQVTSIGSLDSTTSSGSASYPVTISLGSTTQPLYAGSNAALSITLRSAAAAVAVPTSAVRTAGAAGIVEELKNGTLTPVRVTVGVQGTTLTQIMSGVNPGDQVVLADLGEALPTSNTNTRGLTGGGGGFGGGGRGGTGGTGGGGARTGG
jgi:HlyD family secretion protein